MNIEEQIRQFILQNLYYAEDTILGEDDSFLETGVVDSTGVMELVAFIDAEYGVKAAPSELVVENFDSIRRLADFVRKKMPATKVTAAGEVPETTPGLQRG